MKSDLLPGALPTPTSNTDTNSQTVINLLLLASAVIVGTTILLYISRRLSEKK